MEPITVWYLSTCSTCQRILRETDLDKEQAQLIDLKQIMPSEDELREMKESAGSYKALINGRSTQFRGMNVKAADLSEKESQALLRQHYSFLKRPVIRIGKDYFIGNSKGTVEAVKERLINL